MRYSLLLLAVLLVGCPPVREDATGDGTDGPSYLQSAVWFLWGEPTRDYELAGLHMLGADYGCDDVFSFDIDWWGLEAGADFVGLGLLRGSALEGWDREFPSYYSWSQSGNDYVNSAYFYGTWGVTGPQDWGDDDDWGGDDDRPVGRDVTGYLGQEFNQADDVLRITSYSDARVVGVTTGHRTIDGQVEEYRFNFNAENCGTLGGAVPPGEDEPPQDGGGGWDPGR